MVKIYLIIVYDVNIERVNKVHKFLRTHLHWQQNSVFEGEVSKSQYNIILEKLKMKKIILIPKMELNY